MFCCDRADVNKSFFGIVTCSECFFKINRGNKNEQANLVSRYHPAVCKQMQTAVGDHCSGMSGAGLMKESQFPEGAIPKESLELRKE